MRTSTSTSSRAGRSAGTRVLCAVAAACAMAVLAACGASAADPADGPADPGSAGADPTVIEKATLVAGDEIPAPRGRPVITVTGDLSAANRGRTVQLDLATVESVGLMDVEVYEPWAKKDLAFHAVDLADLLDVAGAPSEATSVHLTALDDYEVDLSMDDIRAGGVLVATASGNGHQLTIDKGGPTRIIFTDGTEAGAASEQWLWSIQTIDLR